MTDSEQRATWDGRTFQELDQHKRIEILHNETMINQRVKEAFELLKEKRKWYLHYYSMAHDKLQHDALLCYERAVRLVIAVLSQELRGDRFAFRPEIIEYLKRAGCFRDEQAAPDGDVQWDAG